MLLDCGWFMREVALDLRAGFGVMAGLAIALCSQFNGRPWNVALDTLIPVYVIIVNVNSKTIGGHIRNAIGLMSASLVAGSAAAIGFAVFQSGLNSQNVDAYSFVLLGVFVLVSVMQFLLEFSGHGIDKGIANGIFSIFFITTYFRGESLATNLISCCTMQLNAIISIYIGLGMMIFPWPGWTSAHARVRTQQEAAATRLVCVLEGCVHCLASRALHNQVV